MAVYLHSIAEFTCSVGQGRPRLFWFVNSVTVSALPAKYGASFTSHRTPDGMGTTSTLQILALEETNNSMIQCGVDISVRIDLHYFSSSAYLLVQGIDSFSENKL